MAIRHGAVGTVRCGRPRRAGPALLALLAVLAVVVAVPAVVAAAPAPERGAAGTTEPYYVSLGDSYSVGIQAGRGPTTGYTGVVAGALGMQLENFGCSGATTTTLLHQVGCAAGSAASTDAVPYPTTTQLEAATSFLQAHPGRVGLITVSVGGDTVIPCASAAAPLTCVIVAMDAAKANLAVITADLRAAVGPGVPLIGLTYPDVFLGDWVYPPGATNPSGAAELAVTAFKDYINPTLKAAYAAVGGSFVDVTAATGGTTPLTDTVTLPPYGTIPVAVARVCQLTYYCALGTVHANTAGYALIGTLIVSTFEHPLPHVTGYWAVASDGGIFAFGTSAFHGSMGGKPLNTPIVGMAATPTGGGYWEVAADGGLFAFGNAAFHGSMGGKPLNTPIVGMAATPTGGGYWEVASDGGLFAFGNAAFHGSMGGRPLNSPVVGLAATPTGGGYWEVAADGGLFAFGNAAFHGSMGGQPLVRPIVGMQPTPTGGGYWEVAGDGGIFSFGNARYYGSMGGLPLVRPIIGLAPTPTGTGYWEVASDGGVFAFGTATFYGSTGGQALNQPIVGVAAFAP